MRKIRQIIIHCADTPVSMDIGVEEIRKWHTSKPRNWSDVGYHLIIRRGGEVEQGRDYAVPGAHAAGYNSDSIGICLVGGRSGDGHPDANFTSTQYDALRKILRGLCVQFPGVEILGHRDLPGVIKACPCFDVNAWFGGADNG